jgi:hypothetical protein
MDARRQDTLGNERGLVVHGLSSERPQFNIQTKLRVIGTQFSNLYTAVDTPAEAAWFN